MQIVHFFDPDQILNLYYTKQMPIHNIFANLSSFYIFQIIQIKYLYMD